MTQTPNIGLKKIDGSENWRNVFDYHNDSMDLADEAIAGVRAGLTYVENGDTIAANANYTVGKFISWKGEIYRVKATINTTVTSGNWTTYLDKMDGMGGALSQINDDLTSLNSKITTNEVDDFFTLDSTKATLDSATHCYKTNNIVFFMIDVTPTVGGNVTVGTVASSIRPNKNIYAPAADYTETSGGSFGILKSGAVNIFNATANHEYILTLCYLI